MQENVVGLALALLDPYSYAYEDAHYTMVFIFCQEHADLVWC